MKVIFLDIDGVLNPILDFDLNAEKHAFSKRCIALLNDLVKETGAKIVITSTWESLLNSIDQFQTFFEEQGFKGEIIGFTDKKEESYMLRGNLIYKWIVKYPEKLENYLILDDDDDMLYWQKDNFILIDDYCGLTPTIVYRAIRMLNNY